MIQHMLRTITEQHHLIGMDLGEYRKMKIGGTTIRIYAFYAEGLGHVSAMTVSGFLGLTQRDRLIINPTDVDLPMLTYDRVHAGGEDTLSYELWDTNLGKPDLAALDAVKAQAGELPDHDPGLHGHDAIKLSQSLSQKGKKAQGEAFDRLAMEYLRVFLELARTAEPCDPDAKREKASGYVEGLLRNANPSTAIFRKALGEAGTGDLFRRILFGTQI